MREHAAMERAQGLAPERTGLCQAAGLSGNNITNMWKWSGNNITNLKNKITGSGAV